MVTCRIYLIGSKFALIFRGCEAFGQALYPRCLAVYAVSESTQEGLDLASAPSRIEAR